jgi:hypothetical protein
MQQVEYTGCACVGEIGGARDGNENTHILV